MGQHETRFSCRRSSRTELKERLNAWKHDIKGIVPIWMRHLGRMRNLYIWWLYNLQCCILEWECWMLGCVRALCCPSAINSVQYWSKLFNRLEPDIVYGQSFNTCCWPSGWNIKPKLRVLLGLPVSSHVTHTHAILVWSASCSLMQLKELSREMLSESVMVLYTWWIPHCPERPHSTLVHWTAVPSGGWRYRKKWFVLWPQPLSKLSHLKLPLQQQARCIDHLDSGITVWSLGHM